ncbi:LexA family transcriptional regulator [Ensifer adhaerens]|jgi:transcriptional regulator with XRE-family HTH domain|uniref:LexA family transcriptional regulator n=1 Tax=Ensifer adhaerens TaxID=106592 RepID=UPI0020308959|nr:LexA family transcriptional regulator [Ensifer adhaerens]
MTKQLKKIREMSGLTQADVAAHLEISTENYNRLEKGKTELNLSKLRKLAELFHRDPADFITDHGNVRMVRVSQGIQAGHWAESLAWDENDWYDVAVPDDPMYRHFTLYGAQTEGPSMNKRYSEGSALIYTSIMETGEPPQVGKRYIIERERPDGLREATVKTLWKDEQGEFWLLPESHDPRYQTPLRLADGDGDIVRIVGKVVFSVQRED